MYSYALLLCIIGAANSSVSKLLSLVDEEGKLIEIVERYLQAENARLDKLDSHKNTLLQNAKFYSNEEEFVSNPLSVYKMVKHLTFDRRNVDEMLMRNSYDAVTKLMAERKVVLPDKNQLYDGARMLVQLQRMYNLTAAKVMTGGLAPNLPMRTALAPEDCFYIGQVSAEKQDHEMAAQWLRTCENKFYGVNRDRISKTLISSSLFLGDTSLCRASINKYRRTHPDSRALYDLTMKLNQRIGDSQHVTEVDEWESFKTCVGDYDNRATANGQLKCRYNHHNSPFLIIAPLKEEIMSLVPKISVFREVVYDSEIELLKAEAHHKFRSARTGDRKAPNLHHRPSQTAVLSNEDPRFSKLCDRLRDISSLSLVRSEKFQMIHYAPGGFYRVHSDYIDPTKKDVQILGNRVATALMYLNNVTLGGSTVFPRLKLNVQPVKGSVLFWINMRLDRSEESFTKHAACPVIYGEKIACTQWFRMNGQDHWIAEPTDDAEADYSLNPNFACKKRNFVKQTISG